MAIWLCDLTMGKLTTTQHHTCMYTAPRIRVSSISKASDSSNPYQALYTSGMEKTELKNTIPGEYTTFLRLVGSNKRWERAFYNTPR